MNKEGTYNKAISNILGSLKDFQQLQQENRQLKEKCEFEIKCNIEFASRIDKAIDYITTEQLYTNYQWSEEQYKKILKDLLEILKGDSNE